MPFYNNNNHERDNSKLNPSLSQRHFVLFTITTQNSSVLHFAETTMNNVSVGIRGTAVAEEWTKTYAEKTWFGFITISHTSIKTMIVRVAVDILYSIRDCEIRFISRGWHSSCRIHSQRRTFFSFFRAVSCCYCQHFRCRNFITLIVGFMRSHTTHLTLAGNFIQCLQTGTILRNAKKWQIILPSVSPSLSLRFSVCLLSIDKCSHFSIDSSNCCYVQSNRSWDRIECAFLPSTDSIVSVCIWCKRIISVSFASIG